MSESYLELLSGESVRQAQEAHGSRDMWQRQMARSGADRLTPAEAGFIAARDSFYMASVAETGWPYLQHRGGPKGFLKVLDEATLGFADYRGNRQYITLGNTGADDRVALFLMDYANRARLKILAHLEVRDLASAPELEARLVPPGYEPKVERGLILHVAAFDWNCSQHITPRYSAEEVETAIAPLRAKLAELERENARLRAAAAGIGSGRDEEPKP
jgi:predicted pyridoxine 5'-phosphate oxidase superfamily flavin-nucleotide-binding protein